MSKVVIITGASGGLGEVLAGKMLASGMQVFGTMRDPAASSKSYPFAMLAMDVTSDESVTNCFSQVVEQAGRVDLVVNCFNEMILGSVEETSMAEFESMYAINLFGVIRVSKVAVPLMRSFGGGCIINLSSLGGLLAVPLLSGYTSAKFAIEAFSEALYHEVKRDNIAVVIMQPVAMHMQRGATGSHLKAALKVAPDSITHKMIRKMARDTESSKLTPEKVADEIIAVALAANKPLRKPLDKAKGLALIKRFAPQSVINKMVSGLVSG